MKEKKNILLGRIDSIMAELTALRAEIAASPVSLADMVSAGGYDYVDDDINEFHFFAVNSSEFNLDLDGEPEYFKFDFAIKTVEDVKRAKKIMSDDGYDPFGFEKTLALGAKQCELVESGKKTVGELFDTPIFCLDFFAQDSYGLLGFLVLYGNGGRRHLNIDWFGRANPIPAGWRCPCVRKESSGA